MLAIRQAASSNGSICWPCRCSNRRSASAMTSLRPASTRVSLAKRTRGSAKRMITPAESCRRILIGRDGPADHLAEALARVLSEQRSVWVAPHQFAELVSQRSRRSRSSIGHHRVPHQCANVTKLCRVPHTDFRRRWLVAARSRGAGPRSGAVSWVGVWGSCSGRRPLGNKSQSGRIF